MEAETSSHNYQVVTSASTIATTVTYDLQTKIQQTYIAVMKI